MGKPLLESSGDEEELPTDLVEVAFFIWGHEKSDYHKEQATDVEETEEKRDEEEEVLEVHIEGDTEVVDAKHELLGCENQEDREQELVPPEFVPVREKLQNEGVVPTRLLLNTGVNQLMQHVQQNESRLDKHNQSHVDYDVLEYLVVEEFLVLAEVVSLFKEAVSSIGLNIVRWEDLLCPDEVLEKGLEKGVQIGRGVDVVDGEEADILGEET